MPKLITRFLSSAMFSVCLLAACMAFSTKSAAEDYPAEIVDVVETPYSYLSATPVYQFDSDLDDGGSVSVFRLLFNASRKITLSETLKARFNLGYAYADYNFSDPQAFAGVKPWDKVHNLSFGGSLAYVLAPDWSILVAPKVEVSREDGAKWGNAFQYGGAVSVTREFGPSLTLGIGAAVFSKLEQVKAFPLLILSWQITDRLTLANPSPAGPAGPAGLELSYRLDDGWNMKAGVAFRSESFRLKNSGPYADGIGKFKSIPAWGCLSRIVGEHFKLDLYGGVMFGGEVRVDDSEGDRLASDDYDPAPFMALTISSRF